MAKNVEEIYDKIDTYLGYLKTKKMTRKQVQNGIFTLMIEYNDIPPRKRISDTKKICREKILGMPTK